MIDKEDVEVEDASSGDSGLYYIQEVVTRTEINDIKHNRQEAIDECKKVMRRLGTVLEHNYNVFDYDTKQLIYETKDDEEFGDEDFIFEVYRMECGKPVGKVEYSGPHLHKAYAKCKQIFHQESTETSIVVRERE